MSSGYFQARWHPDDPMSTQSNPWVDVLVIYPSLAATEFVQYEFDNWGSQNESDFVDGPMRVQVRRPESHAISEYIVTGEMQIVFTPKFKESTK